MLFGNRIVVNVEDAVWQAQLTTMRQQIIDRLAQVLGRKIVTDIQFRVVPPRPKPQRETEAFALDEADGIPNPVLRRIYRASRKRATG